MSSADPKLPDSRAVAPLGGDRKPATVAKEWRVTDDLPRPAPVGRAEIEVLETYLGAQIDDILRRMRR